MNASLITGLEPIRRPRYGARVRLIDRRPDKAERLARRIVRPVSLEV